MSARHCDLSFQRRSNTQLQCTLLRPSDKHQHLPCRQLRSDRTPSKPHPKALLHHKPHTRRCWRLSAHHTPANHTSPLVLQSAACWRPHSTSDTHLPQKPQEGKVLPALQLQCRASLLARSSCRRPSQHIRHRPAIQTPHQAAACRAHQLLAPLTARHTPGPCSSGPAWRPP
jgi:hypothetical protein